MPPDGQDDVQIEAPEDIRSGILAAIEAQESPADDTGDDAPKTETRQRGPDGKFLKASDDVPTDTAPVVTTEQKSVDPTPAAPSVEAPSNWAAADKDMFGKIPPEAREFVMRRYKDMEADHTRKTQEIATFRKEYDPVDQMFAPFADQIKAAGFTKAGLIQAWAGVERKLTSGQGVEVIADLQRNYNLDKAQIARALGITSPAAGVETPPPVDGTTPIQLPSELLRELQELKNGHQQVSQTVMRQEQARQTEATNRVMSTIAAFRDAKDQSGNLLHPHYDNLENDMVVLANGVRASGGEPDLKDLYDKAVWANPSTRQKVLDSQNAAQEAQRKATEEQQRKEARAKAERARRAGSSVTGTPGSSQTAITAAKADGGSIRDALMAAVEEHSDAA